ncbi:tetratricopeptide repeat-containing sulfotransferase family protein [Altererythrobacter sp. MF3-039]|uniref:tetratricopeptide repeat-containing sulfotransferase family protein n=1 Tax=Altererythrobacter sp. MF3-039 TaxID=3252901 RepID=UPI00390C88C5
MAKKELFAGRFRQAHAAAQGALKANPRADEAVLVMAAIAIEHGNAPGAAKLCGLLVERDLQACWLSVLLARVALLQQDQEAARGHALAAHKLGTREPHIANQLGVVLSRTGWHREAVAPFRIAVGGVPQSADYRYNLAVALQFVGDLQEAEAQFSELIARHPDHASGWLALVQLASAPLPDWAPVLEAQIAQASDPDKKLLFGHALARIAETQKHWDKSFNWLQEAKRAKRSEVMHDRRNVEALAVAARAAAEQQNFADETEGDERPIFIVGMPRSGTTLVERILTSHSAVTSVGELSDFAIVLKQALGTPGPHVLDPEVLQAAAKSPDLAGVGEDYLRRAGALAGEAARFIDKMPFNSFFVPAILKALPGARIICLRRSPHDLLFANFRQLFATGFSYYSYSYDFGDAAHFIAQFEEMADHYAGELPAGRFHSVCYENVIADQRGETERLLEFCGLGWEDACMDFHRNVEPVATASSVQVRSPLYSSSLEQWRRYGEGSKIAVAELGRYGIEPD